jgi:hypothetical protein
MATETYNIPHSGNANVVTRIVLTDVSPGVLNYSISLVRLTDGVQSFNNFGAPSGPNIVNVSIFGVSIPQRFYTFDWAYSTTRTVTRQRGSSTLRNISDTSLYRIGMTRQSGIGIPASAAINQVGSTTVSITEQAFTTGTASATFSRALRSASILIDSNNINVTPGATGSISGTNAAGGTVGSATLSGTFTSLIAAPSFVTTSPLTAATRDRAYSNQISADRASNYSISSGSLPTGLSMSSSGLISGTPTVLQNSSFDITASNAGGSTVRGFTLAVNFPVPEFTTVSPLPIAIRGSSYSTTISAIDADANGYSLVSGSLPTELTLGSNGVISGTPTTLQTASFTIRASNSLGNTDKVFSLTVNPPAPVFTDQIINERGARNVPYQSEVVAADAGYGITSPQTAYSIFSGSLPPGLTLDTSTGIIGKNTEPTQAPTVIGTYQFVIRATNVTGFTNTGTLEIIVTNNFGRRRTETGFENIASARRFDGTNWIQTTVVKRFDATLGWVDVTNS